MTAKTRLVIWWVIGGSLVVGGVGLFSFTPWSVAAAVLTAGLLVVGASPALIDFDPQPRAPTPDEDPDPVRRAAQLWAANGDTARVTRKG